MIYTLYSYKGGVGRSMALANLAETFYKAGLRVLMVDWDLEAPGLERFFLSESEIEEVAGKPGVMEMLLGYKKLLAQEFLESTANKDLPFEKLDRFVIDMYPNSSDTGKLWLLTAGKHSKEHFNNYAKSVLTFDWQDFYQNWEGSRYVEWLRQEFLLMADIVLIDSRTGVTEMGGVCTYQFADVIVMFCAANQQNLDGTREMLLDFKDPRVQEIRRRPLEVLVVPARIENSESDYLNEFQTKFLNLFTKYTPPSLSFGPDMFDQLSIPYSPRYAYRETLAVREKNKASARKIVDSFNRLAFAMSRLAPKDSAIRLAIPETELIIGDETVIGSVLAGDVIVGNKVVSSNEGFISGNIIGDTVVTNIVNTYGSPYSEEQAYLDGVLSRYEIWDSLYVPLAATASIRIIPKETSRLNLPKSFIPYEFGKILFAFQEGREKIEERQELVEDLRALVEKHCRLLLLGEPGSGKTTTLQRLACDFARAAKADADAPIPVLLSLNTFNDDEHFDTFLSRHLGPLAPYVDTYRSKRGLVLLLDGLNEMPKEQFARNINRIQRSFSDNLNDTIVITCRTMDYTPDILQFDTVNILNLNTYRIHLFLNNFLQLEDSENLFQILNSNNKLLELCNNPYMLFMIIQVYVSQKSFPANHMELVNVFVEVLLSREQKRGFSEWIDITYKKLGLAALAKAIKSQSSTSVELTWALEQIGARVSGCDARQLLYLAASANLLYVRETSVRFTHEMFQEFFASYQ